MEGRRWFISIIRDDKKKAPRKNRFREEKCRNTIASIWSNDSDWLGRRGSKKKKEGRLGIYLHALKSKCRLADHGKGRGWFSLKKEVAKKES